MLIARNLAEVLSIRMQGLSAKMNRAPLDKKEQKTNEQPLDIWDKTATALNRLCKSQGVSRKDVDLLHNPDMHQN